MQIEPITATDLEAKTGRTIIAMEVPSVHLRPICTALHNSNRRIIGKVVGYEPPFDVLTLKYGTPLLRKLSKRMSQRVYFVGIQPTRGGNFAVVVSDAKGGLLKVHPKQISRWIEEAK